MNIFTTKIKKKDKLYFRKLPRKIIHIDLDKCYNDIVTSSMVSK